MKKFGILIIAVVLLACLFAGCGENTGKVIENEDITLNYADKAGESVSLPDSYPEKDFPVYKDANISVAAKDDTGSFVVMAYSKDSIKKVVDFYKEVLKDAAVMSTQDEDTAFLSIGTMNKYTYTVAVNEGADIEGYNTTISITLMPEISAD
jgi:hypothetical protein